MSLSDSKPHALVYDQDLSLGGGTAYVSSIIAAALSTKFQVTLCGPQAPAISVLEERCSIDLPGVNVKSCASEDRGFVSQARSSDLFSVTHATWIPPYGRRNLFYCHFPLRTRWKKIGPVTLPFTGKSFYAHQYDSLLCLSLFTREWMDRLWGVKARVAYPYVSGKISPQEKKNVILALGRFDPVKKLEGIVGYFRKFVNQCAGEWELILAGFPAVPSYVDQIRALAKDLPIRFELDVSGERKATLLGEAKILWSVRGLDDPDFPVCIEHFGIPVLEAMHASTVPVSYKIGGPSEIISSSGEDGILVGSEDELLKESLLLASNPTRLMAMGENARKRALYFSRDRFDREILQASLGV